MLMTAWLSVLSNNLHTGDQNRPDRAASRRDPWRNSTKAYRSNPFVPPERVKASRGSRLRPSELRWLIRQRQIKTL